MMWTRRRFAATLAGGAIAAGGAALLWGQAGKYAVDDSVLLRLRAFSAREYVIFRAAARRILAPDENGVPSADELGVAEYADAWLSEADEWTRKDFSRLLSMVEHGTPFFGRFRKRFTDLPKEAQDEYLSHLSQSSIAIVRQGMAGLKSLCLMGYYRDARSWAILGYEGPIVQKGWAGGEANRERTR
jgi:hypothetical protein